MIVTVDNVEIVLSQSSDKTVTLFVEMRDGQTGRVNAYIHLIGMEVQHGYAGGYGYDKRTASIIGAVSNCNDIWAQEIKSGHVSLTSVQQNFINLLLSDKAQGGWLEVINHDNGFIVIQAV